jgi:hypothetical protein
VDRGERAHLVQVADDRQATRSRRETPRVQPAVGAVLLPDVEEAGKEEGEEQKHGGELHGDRT